jgi:hypothetical protein
MKKNEEISKNPDKIGELGGKIKSKKTINAGTPERKKNAIIMSFCGVG